MVKITVIPYKADMVNHAMNNEMTKITVTPYQAGTVNHAMMNKPAKITDTILVLLVQLAPSTTQMKAD